MRPAALLSGAAGRIQPKGGTASFAVPPRQLSITVDSPPNHSRRNGTVCIPAGDPCDHVNGRNPISRGANVGPPTRKPSKLRDLGLAGAGPAGLRYLFCAHRNHLLGRPLVLEATNYLFTAVVPAAHTSYTTTDRQMPPVRERSISARERLRCAPRRAGAAGRAHTARRQPTRSASRRQTRRSGSARARPRRRRP